MGLFGLNWFKSEKEKELEELKLEEQKLHNDLMRVNIENQKQSLTPKIKSLYLSLKLVGDVLTVILEDGSLISKTEATAEDFRKVKNSRTLDDILGIIGSHSTVVERIKEKEAIKKIENAAKGLEILKGFKDFEIKDNTVFFKTSKRSLPPLLVAKFVNLVDPYIKTHTIPEIEQIMEKNDEYQGLKNFFMWACLNPRAEVAADLYDFLDRNSFRITKQGFFVALRNVVTVAGTNTEVVQFISNAYNKVKAVWHRNPVNYWIKQEDNGAYSLSKDGKSNGITKVLGNLEDLYKDLPNMVENRFTDDYTKTFDIRVGQVTNMPMKDCSWSTRDCMEAGLHFTADQIHYVGCGDTSVLVLINPMKVVGIGTHKGRCYEYLPIMTVPRDEATEILHDIDFDTLELDEDYAIRELAKLTEIAKAGFIAETTKNQFNLPAISNVEMKNIIDSLSTMKKTLKKRVSIIK